VPLKKENDFNIMESKSETIQALLDLEEIFYNLLVSKGDTLNLYCVNSIANLIGIINKRVYNEQPQPNILLEEAYKSFFTRVKNHLYTPII